MLNATIAMLLPIEISAGLERLMVVEKLIKTDAEPPYINEREMASLDLVLISYKRLEQNDAIRKKYPDFKVYQAYGIVQSKFARQQIDEASYALTDMHKTYLAIKDGTQPRLKRENLDEFRNALDRFRDLVNSGKLERKYAVALPILGMEYAEIEKYVMPKNAKPEAMPVGV